jgi:hypothetical protein
VAAIAASVSAPYVIDHRLWCFVLHLERRDQGVLCGDRHTLPVAGDIDSNREFEGLLACLTMGRSPSRVSLLGKTSGLLAALGEEITLVEDILQVAGRNNKRFEGPSHSRRSSTRLSGNQPVPRKRTECRRPAPKENQHSLANLGVTFYVCSKRCG